MRSNIPPPPVSFIVPLVPPSVNSYVRHARTGRHYISSEAARFKRSFSLFGKHCIRWKQYGVSIKIYLARKQKGDLDNFAKCVIDGLVEAEIIDSDAKIVELKMEKHRDINNPRTEIAVWGVEKPKETNP